MNRILAKAKTDKSLTSNELQDLRAEFAEGGRLRAFSLANTALNHSIESSGSSQLTNKAIGVEMERLKASLGYGTSPVLERLLIDQVCMCHYRMWMAEFRHTERRNMDGLTINQRMYDEKSLTMIQARYLKAIETLAKVRRLKLPAVQVNVAEAGAKQLNVASSA